MRLRAAVVGLTALVALGACTSDSPPPVAEASAAAPGPTSTTDVREWADATLAAMTIEEKVGQLFVVRVYGTSADASDADAVTRNTEELGVDNAIAAVTAFHVGGVVYFAENVTTPKALAEFGNALQSAAATQRVAIPVLTAIDQEQGSVVRVGPPATQFPGSMALGAGRSVQDAEIAARITGEELRAMGVFHNYAPVADVNANPANPVIGVRSFSSRPSLVARMVRAQVKGYESAGVAATAKHFPGHGDTSIDSHTGLPVIDVSRKSLRRVDLKPFRAAIASGVDSIMTAHIQVPALDPSGDPATLSEPIVTGVLRESLGYDGVVITDSLRMEGVRTKYGDERIPVLAILAGVDQLLDPPNLPAAFAAVLSAVSAGEITINRLDESVHRILILKASLGLTNAQLATVDASAADTVVGSTENLSAAAQITDRTTTLVKDSSDLVPVDSVDGTQILVTGWGTSALTALTANLRAHGAAVNESETGSDPDPAAIAAAVAAAGGVDLIIATTHDVAAHPEQRSLIEVLTSLGVPMVVVALGTPYDISAFPSVPAFIATYSYQPVAIDSLVRVLTGEIESVGRLPVDITVEYGPRRILYPFGWRESQ